MKRSFWSKAGFRITLVLALLALVLVALDVGLDEPLRRRMERMMNESLQGYSVHIARLDFHIWGGSLDLYDLQVSQNAHPDPPVAVFQRLSASVQWKTVVRGRIVGDIELRDPVLQVNLVQLSEESKDEVPVEQRGWQQAVEAIYPFKINELIVHGGELTYIDQDPNRPLQIHDVEMRADNIRNVISPERTYPSEVSIRARVFEAGSLSFEGEADFMSEPHAGVHADVDVQQVDLSYVSPVLERFGLIAHQGRFSVRGDLEYGPAVQNVLVDEMVISGTNIEYLYRTAAAPEQEAAKEEIVEAAGEVQNSPELLTRIRELRVEDSSLSIADKGARPPYAVFWNHIDMTAQNISNQAADGEATAHMTAKFMGSGPTSADITLLPAARSPDFRLAIGIENTDMRSLNNLFRAHGNFDVAAGRFSFYSEVRVRDGRIAGYVKPLFRDVKVYDPAQDRSEGFWHRTWERLVGVANKILRNRQRQEVATRVDISGNVDDPHASTLQVVLNLAKNAFVRAILPGLEHQTGTPGGVDEGGRKEKKRERKEEKDRKRDRKAASGIILEEIPEAASLSIL